MYPEYLALPPGRRRWGYVLCFLLLALTEICLGLYAEKQVRLYTTTGLRFAAPLNEEQLVSVQEHQCSAENEQQIYASFWGQTEKNVSAEYGRTAQQVICIGYSGNAGDCLPIKYLAGGAPGIVGKECSISSPLAETLFGNNQVVGLYLTADQQTFRITGVFSAGEAILLYPTTEELYCAELQGVSLDTPKADVLIWCAAAGLPAPQTIVYGPQRIWFARCFSIIPLLLVGMAGLVTLLRCTTSWPTLIHNGIWFALVLALALMLPTLLSCLPGWLIPSRWSDFSFWQVLADEIHKNRLSWENGVHYWRDWGKF